MAYKFQLGAAVMSGALAQEGGIDVYDDSNALKASLSNAGALDVKSLELNSGGITSAGAIAGATTATLSGLLSSSAAAQLQGNVMVGGTLNVTGNANFDGTLACDDSFTIDAVSLNATELGFLDGVTAGTAAASKALVLDASRDIATVRKITADGLLSSSAGAQIVGNAMVGGTLNVTGAATLASTLSASSNISANQLQIANTESSGSTVSGSNGLMFIDAADGFLKTLSFQNYASQLAGTGITATNGELSVDTTGGDSVSSAALAVSGTAVVGMNYMTTVSSSVGVNLPASPSAGDVVYIKAKDGVDPNASPAAVITISKQGSHTVDGETSIELESPYASVGLIYVAANDWRII